MGDKIPNVVKKGNSSIRETLKTIPRPANLSGNGSPLKQRNAVTSPSKVALPAAPEADGLLIKNW